MPIRTAAEKYDVPKSTVARWAKVNSLPVSFSDRSTSQPYNNGTWQSSTSRHEVPVPVPLEPRWPIKKPGGQPSLTKEEEVKIANNIMTACEWGFPISSFDLRLIVKQYFDSCGKRIAKFKNNLPGRDWVVLFLKRHKELLSERWSQNIKRSRARINKQLIGEYFGELRVSLQGISSDCLINYDETNLVDDPSKKKVIVRRGMKHCNRIMDSSKSSVSVMFSGTASGKLLPPYVVYGAEHLCDTWRQGGPKDALYGRSKSSWFNECLFQDWFEGIALPYFKTLPQESPKALIGDNLASHISVAVLKKCRENNIRFVLLPPNSTHLCQPLDVAYFQPFKLQWRKTLEEWKLANRGPIPKDTFPLKLKQTLDRMNADDKTSKNLISGFRKCGIYPLCAEKVLEQVPETQNTNDQANNGINSAVDRSFETFMKRMFQRETQPLRKQCRRKLNVPAGRSVENVDLSEEDNSDDPQDTSDIENQNEVITTTPDQNSESEVHALRDLKEGDFIVATFNYEGKKGHQVIKKYIGKVLSVSEKTIEVSFMRKSIKVNTTYIFPLEPDIAVIQLSQIVAIIQPKNIHRNRYVFGYEDAE